MRLDIQYQINQDPKKKTFLRENSYWYKYLNRNGSYYQDFIEDMKNKYQLHPVDKMARMLNDIQMVKNILDILK